MSITSNEVYLKAEGRSSSDSVASCKEAYLAPQGGSPQAPAGSGPVVPQVMKTPKSVDIDITDRCNLRCKYCSHFTSAGDVGKDLPTEEWLAFFEELGRCAFMDVTLSGGEPFIREDLKEIIEGIVRNRMHLKRYNLPVTVRVTIHRKNVYDLENVSRLLLDELGLPGFSTNSASHLRLCRKNAEMVQLTVEEVRALGSSASHLLRPLYSCLAQNRVLKRWFASRAAMRIISLNRPEGEELQLLVGQRVIGRRPAGRRYWLIRKAFMLFVDEKSLPLRD